MPYTDEYGSGSGGGEEIELPQLPQLPLRPSLYDAVVNGMPLTTVFWPEGHGVPPGVGPNSVSIPGVTDVPTFSVESTAPHWPVIPWWVWALLGYVAYEEFKTK